MSIIFSDVSISMRLRSISVGERSIQIFKTPNLRISRAFFTHLAPEPTARRYRYCRRAEPGATPASASPPPRPLPPAAFKPPARRAAARGADWAWEVGRSSQTGGPTSRSTDSNGPGRYRSPAGRRALDVLDRDAHARHPRHRRPRRREPRRRRRAAAPRAQPAAAARAEGQPAADFRVPKASTFRCCQ